jgi:hypothetical protein
MARVSQFRTVLCLKLGTTTLGMLECRAGIVGHALHCVCYVRPHSLVASLPGMGGRRTLQATPAAGILYMPN